MTGWDVALIGAALIAYALISRRLEGTFVTAPMAFVVIGFTVGIAHGMTAPWLTDRSARWLDANRNELTFETEDVAVGSRTRHPRRSWPGAARRVEQRADGG